MKILPESHKLNLVLVIDLLQHGLGLLDKRRQMLAMIVGNLAAVARHPQRLDALIVPQERCHDVLARLQGLEMDILLGCKIGCKIHLTLTGSFKYYYCLPGSIRLSRCLT